MKDEEKEELRTHGKPEPAVGDDGSEMSKALRDFFFDDDFDFVSDFEKPCPGRVGDGVLSRNW